VTAGSFLVCVAIWQLAVVHFPETMHQVRLIMLLFAIGGPDG
jgi:hypothetical protein